MPKVTKRGDGGTRIEFDRDSYGNRPEAMVKSTGIARERGKVSLVITAPELGSLTERTVFLYLTPDGALELMKALGEVSMKQRKTAK